MLFESNISGDKELLATFQKLPRTTRTAAVRPALREGASLISKMAAVNVKIIATKGYSTATLEKNIRYYNLKDLRGMSRVAVQVRRKAVNTMKIVNGQPVRIGLYASVLEYGKKNQAPVSWIRKAAREGAEPATNIILKGIEKRMSDAIEKAKK